MFGKSPGSTGSGGTNSHQTHSPRNSPRSQGSDHQSHPSTDGGAQNSARPPSPTSSTQHSLDNGNLRGELEGAEVSGRKHTRPTATGADSSMQSDAATVQHQAKYTLRNIHGIWVIKTINQLKLHLPFDDPTDVHIEEEFLFVDGKLFEIIEDKGGKPCLIPLPRVEISNHPDDFLDRGTMRTTRRPLSAKMHTIFEYVARKISNIWIVTNKSLSRTYQLEFDGSEDIKVEDNFLLAGNGLYELFESKRSPLHLLPISTAKVCPKSDSNEKSDIAVTRVVKTKGKFIIRRLKCGWIITSHELYRTFRLPFNDKKDVHMADEFLFVDGELYEIDMGENGELFLGPLAQVLLQTTMPTSNISKPVVVDKIRQIGHIWTLTLTDAAANFQFKFDGFNDVHMAEEFVFADGGLHEILEMYGNLYTVPLQKVQTLARSYEDGTSEDEVETDVCGVDNGSALHELASDEYTSLKLSQRSHAKLFQQPMFDARKSTAHAKDNALKQVKSTASTEDCVICMEQITEPKTLPCGHSFCTDCIDLCFKVNKQACPTCGKVCGITTGDQPDGTFSTTTHSKSVCSCAGYEQFGRTSITYNFPNGKQEPSHPNPGQWYKGIVRTAYLPDNPEGRKIRDMLKVAFDRKLVFTIGHSKTTGRDGVITWNDIHHKTDPRPGTHSSGIYKDNKTIMFACIFFLEDTSLSVVESVDPKLEKLGEFSAHENVRMKWGKQTYHGTIIKVADFVTAWCKEHHIKPASDSTMNSAITERIGYGRKQFLKEMKFKN